MEVTITHIKTREEKVDIPDVCPGCGTSVLLSRVTGLFARTGERLMETQDDEILFGPPGDDPESLIATTLVECGRCGRTLAHGKWDDDT